MLRLPLVLCALAVSSSSSIDPTPASTPKNGEELIALMRDRYAGKWYKTLTFVQKTTFPDGKI
ncbi:MAG TPA: hypothetical protein VFS51_07075, partial [Gemmatimonadales bacterium]|nr:hypothetical protein [Gemmatimonadales bacterium]